MAAAQMGKRTSDLEELLITLEEKSGRGTGS
jgi:hypothetical protein